MTRARAASLQLAGASVAVLATGVVLHAAVEATLTLLTATVRQSAAGWLDPLLAADGRIWAAVALALTWAWMALTGRLAPAVVPAWAAAATARLADGVRALPAYLALWRPLRFVLLLPLAAWSPAFAAWAVLGWAAWRGFGRLRARRQRRALAWRTTAGKPARASVRARLGGLARTVCLWLPGVVLACWRILAATSVACAAVAGPLLRVGARASAAWLLAAVVLLPAALWWPAPGTNATPASRGERTPPVDRFTAREHDTPSLVARAVEGGARVDVRDWQGRTPLLEALDRLVDARRGLLSPSPAARAAAGRRVERLQQVVQSLIERGSALDARDRADRSVAYLGLEAALPAATIERLLAAAPVGLRTTAGASLVHAAAASGDTRLLARVLERGEDITALTRDRQSALHFARGEAMVLALLARGLDPDAVDQRGQTPFHLAVQRRDLAATGTLGRYSADRARRDLFGRAALDYLPAVVAAGSADGAARDAWRALAESLDGQG